MRPGDFGARDRWLRAPKCWPPAARALDSIPYRPRRAGSLADRTARSRTPAMESRQPEARRTLRPRLHRARATQRRLEWSPLSPFGPGTLLPVSRPPPCKPPRKDRLEPRRAVGEPTHPEARRTAARNQLPCDEPKAVELSRRSVQTIQLRQRFAETAAPHPPTDRANQPTFLFRGCHRRSEPGTWSSCPGRMPLAAPSVR